MSGVTIVQIVDTSTTVSTTGDAVTIVQGVENAGPPGPAVIDASYLVLGTNTTLTAERVLTAGTGIDFTDAGAGSTLTVDVDPSEFANGTVPIASLASTPLLLTGGTMTGQLTLTRASAADVALIARLAADTQGRYRVDAYGRQWWDPSGAAATPPIYNTAFVSGGYGLLIYGFDDASITSGSPAGFQVVAARGAHPHFILTALNGTGASPTKLLTGDTLGEFAFQGQYGSTVGQIVTGAALITYAVEDWTLSGGTGAALSLQTRPRGPAYGGIRVESLLIFDSGQIQMDPGDARGGGVTWTLPNSRLRVVSQSATERTLVLKAHASQSENIQEWRNSAETVLAAIDETGAGSFAAGTTVGGTTVAPSDASYVVLGTNGTLANERVLTEGTGIDITDAGAGSTVTIAVDPSEFTNGSVPLASIADIATARLLGRTTAGSGAIEELTQAGVFGFLGTGTPSATTYLRGDGSWSTPASGGSVATDAIFDAKGDLAVGTGADTASKLTVGANSKVLTADSAESTGAKWDYAVPPLGSPKTGATTYYVTPGVIGTGQNNLAIQVGCRHFFFFWTPTAITVDQIAIEQITAAAAGKLFRLGLIACDEWWQPTGTALMDSGNFAADGANGVKTYTPGAAVLLPPGRYAGTVHSDGGPQIRVVTSGSVGSGFSTTLGASFQLYSHRVSTPLAAVDTTPWDTTNGSTVYQHGMWLRLSDPTS